VLATSIGTSTVREGPSLVAKISDTGSLVAQLTPKSAVTTCLMKIQSCTA
jgi:hypothetical protein